MAASSLQYSAVPSLPPGRPHVLPLLGIKLLLMQVSVAN